VPSEADLNSESISVQSVAIEGADFASLLEKAKDFHGHLGPFLVLGVRAGLRGLKELGTRKENLYISASVLLRYSVPYSCVLDGIQMTTGCTIGNKRLRFEDSSNLVIKLRNKSERAVTISILPEVVSWLEEELAKEASTEAVAYKAASMPEEELFTVEPF
jgi:formylmethanofuran dehydrogenase subunit E